MRKVGHSHLASAPENAAHTITYAARMRQTKARDRAGKQESCIRMRAYPHPHTHTFHRAAITYGYTSSLTLNISLFSQ